MSDRASLSYSRPEAVSRSHVIHAKSSEARNTATRAISSGWPEAAERRRRHHRFLEIAADNARGMGHPRSPLRRERWH